MKSIYSYFLAVIFIFAENSTHAQCGAQNLLLNAGFESPVVPNVNANNIQPGNVWGNWTVNFSGGINVIRVDGTGYLPGNSIGPDTAADKSTGGGQYIDITSSSGTLSQSFTLTSATLIYFSGSFSNRESANSFYVPWSASIQILDNTGTQVAISNTINFTAAQGDKTWFTAYGTAALPPGSYTFSATIGDFGHFDNASVCNYTVLPITLESFSVAQQGKNVIVKWTTSEELNLSHFEIQSSTDGLYFVTRGTVNAGQINQYTFLDVNPGKNVSYYRLKSVDVDQKFSYSKVLKINLVELSTFSIYPNPSKNNLFITIPSSIDRKSATISIVGTDGKLVFKKQVNTLNAVEVLNISTLSNGIYHLIVMTNDQLFNNLFEVIK